MFTITKLTPQKIYASVCLIALVIAGLLRPLAVESQQNGAEPPLAETPLMFLIETQSPTATSTVIPTLIPLENAVLIPTETPVPTNTPDALVITAEATSEATSELIVPSLTDAPTSDPFLSTAEATLDALIMLTAELTPDAEQTLEPVATETPTIQPSVVPLTVLTGSARYQNHTGDNSGIQVIIMDEQSAPIALAFTDANGQYTLSVLSKTLYMLTFKAPLHRQMTLSVAASDAPLAVILEGGDLNGDGCIGPQDMSLLTRDFGLIQTTSDITGDGLTDAADLAILAGNYDESACQPLAVNTPAVPVTESVLPDAPADILPTALATIESLPTLEVTAESTSAVGE